MKSGLRLSMKLSEFDNGYWYATEIKSFAKSIGIAHSGKLRKDELEEMIRQFLKTGKMAAPGKRRWAPSGESDLKKGLRLGLPIVHYVGNRETKAFIAREALKMAPGMRKKSGARYRLNRWREEALAKGRRITYGDLVRQYVTLNRSEKPFKPIPVGRYINFLSEFLSSGKNATRSKAIQAWKELKTLAIPKRYREWKKMKLKSR